MKKRILHLFKNDGTPIGTLVFDSKAEITSFVRKLATEPKLPYTMKVGEVDV